MRIPPHRFKHCLPLLLLSCHACQEPPDSISNEGREDTSATAPALRNAIVDRVWVSTDTTNPPGVMRIFLSDGTLISDSCWETYRLSRWRMEPDNTILWREDTADIRAAILASNDSTLVLRLDLVGEVKQEHYAAAPVPYVCPGVPR